MERIIVDTGYRIRDLRVQQNLSQEQLALKAEMNPAYLGQLERGLKSPTIYTLYRVTRALNVSLSHFFAFDRLYALPEDKTNLQELSKVLESVNPKKADEFIKAMIMLAKLL